MKLDIHIIKNSEVTIREQLFEQIVFLIATGRLKPGEVLPSVGGLARPHKIHHNTVSQAYQDLDDLINATRRTAQEKGYSFQQLRQRVEERLMALPPDHLLVVSKEPGPAPSAARRTQRKTLLSRRVLLNR